MKQYNGVPLDGREMKIQLATSEIPIANPIRGGNRLGNNFNKSKSGPNVKRGNQSQRKTGGGNVNKKDGGANNKNAKGKPRKGGAGGGKQKKAPMPTAEELDAQLEEYVKSKVSTSDGA